MNRLLLFLLTMGLILDLYSQNTENQQEIWLEELTERYDIETNEQDINMFLEQLEALQNDPVDINKTTREELETIPFLSQKQIENILYYRYVYGPFKSIYELRLVEEFDLSTFRLVSSLFRIVPGSEQGVDNLRRKLKNELFIRYDQVLNKKDGYVDKSDSLLTMYPDKQYRGDPSHHSIRYRMERKEQFRLGVMLEKDAGERFPYRNYMPYDYASFYFQYYGKGLLKTCIVGNYKMRWGAGLVVNQSFSMGKTMQASNMLLRNQGISPHSSMDEYNYLQGAALTLRLRNWELTPFLSLRRLDATVEEGLITSIQKTGLHRLPREEERRQQARLYTGGMHLAYRYRWFETGFTWIGEVFNKCYQPELRMYSLYAFRGKKMEHYAVNYQIRSTGFLLSGECALAGNGALATVNALEYTPCSVLRILLLQRYYQRRYYAWSGRSFSEGSEPVNEEGVYLSVWLKPMRYWELSASVDIFRFPWLKYGIDAPSTGSDCNFSMSYQPLLKTLFKIRYRLKIKDKNYREVGVERALTGSYQRHQGGFYAQITPSEKWVLKSVSEMTFYHFGSQNLKKGWLLTQAAGYVPGGRISALDASFSYFNTDGYDTRVYVNEKQILYGFGIPSFAGKGVRASLLTKIELLKNCTCWIRYAHTRYFDRREIGSLLERIDGPGKSELWMQVRLKF